MPFELENLVKIMPGNIIVVAGEPDAGKTAFLLNVLLLNLIYKEKEKEKKGGVQPRIWASQTGALGREGVRWLVRQHALR